MSKRKDPKDYKKRGRKSAFTEDKGKIALRLAKQGKTNAEICEIVGMTSKSLIRWRKSREDFARAFKQNKIDADKEVERSLYERACGYEHESEEIKIIEDADGGVSVARAPIIKKYPPDPTSMIFWLKNRQPDKWRDKKDIGLEGEVEIEVVIGSKKIGG